MTITYNSNNVVTSQNFSTWTASRLTSVTSVPAATNPAGEADGVYSMLADATAGTHSITFSLGSACENLSFYVKGVTYTSCGLRGTTNVTQQSFMLAGDGQFGSSTSANVVARSITNVGDGWYRLSITITPDPATAFTLAFCNSTASSFASTTTGVEEFYIWGALATTGATLEDYYTDDTPSEVTLPTRRYFGFNTFSL